MTRNHQDTTSKPAIFDFMDHANTVMLNQPNDDSIQLQSPEAIALNGLLSDLEFLVKRYQSMAERHWSNYKGKGTVVDYSREQSLTAFGIYSNKAQDMRDLVNKWKLNKK